MGGSSNAVPIISKIFCSPSLTTLIVRKRPPVVNGGGLVVMDCAQKVVFEVDGCGILGARGELMLKDGDGGSILFIRKKGGIIQALSTHNRWNGYFIDYEGAQRFIFSLTDPKCPMNNTIRICLGTKGHSRDWDFEVNGSFLGRNCTINDKRGNLVAQLGMKEPMSQEFYYVVVQPGYDQAFVVGVLAVLDNIHGESTRC